MTDSEAPTPDKTEKNVPPGIAIDGARAKNIREAKKLTQLYVASVVGVTTDTISRWENNRYPSIRRDNAEKLAAALEVDLAEIVRPEAEETQAPSPVASSPLPSQKNKHRIWLVAVLLILVIAIAAISHFLTAPPPAVRVLPHFAAPGEVIPVRITVTSRGKESTGCIVKEKIPAGWILVKAQPAISPGSQYESGELKWLLPGGSGTTIISYTLQVAATARQGEEMTFAGFNVVELGGITRSESVGGTSTIRIGDYHWADSNGDHRIDDNEIFPAYRLTDDMKGFGLDWPTIEAIWNSKGYRWLQSEQTFLPLK
jgi:transcriptional regulator with XRE-family HTH domain